MNQRPSDLLGIQGDYRRYCFDEAVDVYGNAIEAEMQAARESAHKKATGPQIEARAENAMRKMLGLQQKFRGIEALMNPSAVREKAVEAEPRPDAPFRME